MALAAGAFAHAAMSVYATIKQYKINAKKIENAGVGAPGEGMWDEVVMSEARKEPYSPIPRGLYFGFAAANITSGYFLYGRKAQHLCDALNGVVYPKPR